MKADALHCLNAARAQENLPPLSLDARLMQAAENHAAFMARTEKLSHIGVDNSRFDARIRAAGYAFESAAENVACGATDAASVVTLWMESPPHRANILNSAFRNIGIGLAAAANGTLYWSLSLAAPVVGGGEN